MTMEEQEIWAVICEHGYFWRGIFVKSGDEDVWWWEVNEDSLQRERVGECWKDIVSVAEGNEKAEKALPSNPKRRSRSVDLGIPV